MLGLLEGGFYVYPLPIRRLEALFHDHPMGDDVETPFLEISHFVLRFADDDLDQGFGEPLSLGHQPVALGMEFLSGLAVAFGLQRNFPLSNVLVYRRKPGLPMGHDPLVQAGAGDFVDADQHGLAGFPAGGDMHHEVSGQLIQPIIGGDDFVILAQQFFQQGFLIPVEVGLGDGVGDTVIEVESGDAQLLAPVFIDQLDGGAVFLRTLEVVAGDVVAKDAPGQVIVLEQRGTGKAKKGGIG